MLGKSSLQQGASVNASSWGLRQPRRPLLLSLGRDCACRTPLHLTDKYTAKKANICQNKRDGSEQCSYWLPGLKTEEKERRKLLSQGGQGSSVACGLGSQFWLDARKDHDVVHGARGWPARQQENACVLLWKLEQISLTTRTASTTGTKTKRKPNVAKELSVFIPWRLWGRQNNKGPRWDTQNWGRKEPIWEWGTQSKWLTLEALAWTWFWGRDLRTGIFSAKWDTILPSKSPSNNLQWSPALF